jgi:hypothetical protein
MKHISTKQAKRVAIQDMRKEKIKSGYIHQKLYFPKLEMYSLTNTNKLINY